MVMLKPFDLIECIVVKQAAGGLAAAIMKLVRDCCVYIGPLCPVLNKAHGQVDISFLSVLTTT